MRYAVGMDIGGTKLSVSLGRGDGRRLDIVDKIKFPTPKGDYKGALDLMADAACGLLSKARLAGADLAGVGVSGGGPIDSGRGMILSPPNLIGWDEVPVTAYFKQKIGAETRLENDANACALAEWKYGAGRGTRNMVFLTFGTGMGAGLILNGALYSGTNDLAGEVGHCRSPVLDAGAYGPVGNGKAGSYEGFCSGGGIADLARAMLTERLQRGEKPAFCPNEAGVRDITAQDVAAAANAGDPLALEIYERSGRYLGGLLSVLIDILNPEAVVIGSIYARSRHLLEKPMYETMERESIPRSRAVCRILPAELGEDLGDIAALSIVL